MTTTFWILGVTLLLLLTGLVPMEAAALLSLLALFLTGTLQLGQVLAGFSDPTVVMIAGLFVVGAGMFRTGVAGWLAARLVGLSGRNERRLLLLLIVLAAAMSGLLSNTGTVAVLLPAVVAACARLEVNPSRYLLPLAYAASLGGLLTLVGTPPNIVVSNALSETPGGPLGFFEVGMLGVPLLGAFLLLAALGGARGPERDSDQSTRELTAHELGRAYALDRRLLLLRVPQGSPLGGQPLREVRLPERCGAEVVLVQPLPADEEVLDPLELLSEADHRARVGADTQVPAPGVLYAVGEKAQAEAYAREAGLTVLLPDLADEETQRRLYSRERAWGEVVLTQRSAANGKTLRDLRFATRYGLKVVGLLRGGTLFEGDLASLPLAFGDSLLVVGPRQAVLRLARESFDYVVALPGGAAPPDPVLTWRSGVAAFALATMVGLLLAGWVPAVIAVLIAAGLMVLLGALPPADAYRAIDWPSVILIAGMLPLGTALAETGGAEWIANGLVELLTGAPPRVLLGGLFLLAMLLSQFISNTATAVLLAPIALELSARLGVSPRPILLALAAGASSAFLTPIASPVNTLVLGPGGYRFTDFAARGLLPTAIALVVSIALIPWIWPL